MPTQTPSNLKDSQSITYGATRVLFEIYRLVFSQHIPGSTAHHPLTTLILGLHSKGMDIPERGFPIETSRKAIASPPPFFLTVSGAVYATPPGFYEAAPPWPRPAVTRCNSRLIDRPRSRGHPYVRVCIKDPLDIRGQKAPRRVMRYPQGQGHQPLTRDNPCPVLLDCNTSYCSTWRGFC